MRRERTFAILVAIIGCLIFNFNLKLAGEPDGSSSDSGSEASTFNIMDMLTEAIKPAIASVVYPIIGNELVSLAAAADNLLTSAFSSRMTSAKGCSADFDLFARAAYGRLCRNNIISEFGYKSDMYGLVLGVDDVWPFDDEKYFRLGVAVGYVHGRTTPAGTFSRTGAMSTTTFNIDPNQFIAGHDNDTYAIKLFSAYESSDDKCLKTNIGVVLGYNHSRDKLYAKVSNTSGLLEISEKMSASKFVSNSFLLGVEFIKNLYAYKGCQFGLWLKTNYSHTFQRSEVPWLGYKVKLDHDFLVTVVGLNVEKEFFEHTDKKLTLSLKTGWEYQLIQNFDFIHTIAAFAAAAAFNDVNKFFECPVRNSAILLCNVSQNLNNHWSIGGSYSARFNRNISFHGFAAGIEYSF